MTRVFLLSMLLLPCHAIGATIVNMGPKLCPAGTQYNNGTCVEMSQGACPDGYYVPMFYEATYTAIPLGRYCRGSYTMVNMPNVFYPLYNGTLVSNGPMLCGNGQQKVDGVCTERLRENCPENFYDITTPIGAGKDTLTGMEDGECAKGYSLYYLGQNCRPGAVGPLCATLCDPDLEYTGLGTCAALCAGGVTRMHASNGWSLPVYAAPQTAPALHILTPSGDMCHISARPGSGTNTINIKFNDAVYHLID